MSDSKRTHLITVGAPKSAKNNVIKTVRLTINLVESNESKYPELNYKELVIAEERKKKVENGKTTGLDPFSDNDDDVERVARKFEQKYGKKSTYGRKGRSKLDDFADIGAGYDENDSFIDNTHGYDEMIPPGCDTLYGGFYINCGSLEFKNVENQAVSDGEPGANRRNKRRISSSSSEEESSESSSESESQDAKDGKAVANGEVDLHETEHRKKKNKNIDKKANKIRRTDSSAATSGKQTSDDNNHGDGESADSRTSQSDSMTSKPAPSSENAVTSDSSRDVESKAEMKLPHPVNRVVEELEAAVGKLANNPNITAKEVDAHVDQYLIRIERALSEEGCEAAVRRAVYARLTRSLPYPRTKLQHRARALLADKGSSPGNTKRKHNDHLDDQALTQMTAEQKEAKIVETLQKLKVLIEERKPSMMASYDLECRRVQEERRKMLSAGTPHAEKRLPKRRFPWCGRARALLALLARLAGDPRAAAALLALRALPLFPNGFVRMPTLLKQADLSKEIKVSDLKRQRLSPPRPTPAIVQPPQPFTEPIQFPSSLTVTTSVKISPDKVDAVASTDKDKDKPKDTPTVFGNILNTFAVSKDLVVENPKKDEKKEDLYVPRNNLGSITITPVPNNHSKTDKKTIVNNVDKKEALIRVKSPAALNEMAIKEKEMASKSEKDKHKKEKERPKEKPVTLPLHIDTHFNTNRKDPSPKLIEKTQKQIDSMKVNENNIPRPALIPVHHSPTFAKPDKRVERKKKDILIVSDVDPLGDVQSEPLAIDDSSSDVEVVEEKSDRCAKSDKKSAKSDKSEPLVPLDKVTVRDSVRSVEHSSVDCRKERVDDAINEDIDIVMRNLREMEHSQDTAKFNSNSYGGVITNAQDELL